MDYIIGLKPAIDGLVTLKSNNQICRAFVITIRTFFRLYDALKTIEKLNYLLNHIKDHAIYQSNI